MNGNFDPDTSFDFDTNFDFDTMPDRRDGASSKWAKYGDRDIIPLWVADMDFRTAPCVINMLSERVQHGIFGYTQAPRELPDVITHALERDFDWRIDPDWLVWMPSLVVGLNVVSRAFANEGEEVMTAVPIYPPFLSAPRNAGCVALTAPLGQRDGKWVWDFDALEQKVTNKTRTLLLCRPHNPTGRVWTKQVDIIERFGRFPHRNAVLGRTSSAEEAAFASGGGFGQQ